MPARPAPTGRSLVRAPDFPTGARWLNGGYRSLRDLRGRVVLLDFWTPCCINCLHMLPVLHEFERAFPGRVAVIGAAAPKFPAERASQLVAHAMAHYGVTHPVLLDPDHALWDAYAVRGWPTLIIVDPAGRIRDTITGEIGVDELGAMLAVALAEYDDAGLLVPATAPGLRTARRVPVTMPLRFPGKVTVDGPRGRLIVSDSGHHRLVLMDRAGRVETIVGQGSAGFADGTLADATFNDPQGIAVAADGTTLFVADRGNHAIRRVDLVGGQVSTVAGTGARGGYRLDGEASARETALASPWDLAWHGDSLLVAMAGTHQIWRFDPAAGAVRIVAGSGAEAIHDGPLLDAAFAQPSGVGVTGDMAWVLDSESSAVRRVDLTTGQVRRVVGRGLFFFGDIDASGDTVRLQHPVGLTAMDTDGRTRIAIADTFNDRVKWLEPTTRTVTTIAGSGQPGHRDGPLTEARFRQPAGLAIDGDIIWVADTDNHALRRIDLPDRTVSTIDITFE